MQQRMVGSSGFAFSADMKEVAELEAEQALVAANRELIARFEKKSRPRWRACGVKKRLPPRSLA